MTDRINTIGICVATNRKEQILTYIKEWTPYILPVLGGDASNTFRLFIHEDHPTREFELGALASVPITHTCHQDIDSTLKGNAWIIPRKTGASRSFPMYVAWKAGCDYIITMDDDCLPAEEGASAFFESHLAAFRLDRWFRTIDGDLPRGIPYEDKGHLPVLLNHGLWTGVPDLDGPTALVRKRSPAHTVLRAAREVVPPGMWFTLCAMNVCYSRGSIPAAYNLLMGNDVAGFDRFDDIWSGLLLKRIADHLGFFITSGIPFIRHTKASNPFSNLRKEALGIHIHEDFWRYIASAPLGDASSISECYKRLAQWVSTFPREHPMTPALPGYFEKLAEAMLAWTALFSTDD